MRMRARRKKHTAETLSSARSDARQDSTSESSHGGLTRSPIARMVSRDHAVGTLRRSAAQVAAGVGRSSGQPLSPADRAQFEPRFGRDFSSVRLHTGPAAADAARSINARAFTSGKDIAFGQGQYTPGTSSGQRLLAHELAHVVQQSGSDSTSVRPLIQKQEDEPEEKEEEEKQEEAAREEGLKEAQAEEPEEEEAEGVAGEPERKPFTSVTYGAGRFTYTYKGRRPLPARPGAVVYGRWKGVATMKARYYRRERPWYPRLAVCHYRAQYWISNRKDWNHIKNFKIWSKDPDKAVGTPRGARKHERAEIREVRRLWKKMQRRVRAGVRKIKGSRTKQKAKNKWKKMATPHWNRFQNGQETVVDHVDPKKVGPTAEWNYYRRAYRKYVASRRRRRKGRTP